MCPSICRPVKLPFLASEIVRFADCAKPQQDVGNEGNRKKGPGATEYLVSRLPTRFVYCMRRVLPLTQPGSCRLNLKNIQNTFADQAAAGIV